MRKPFVESEHKRDERGRFAKMSTSELKERQTIKLDKEEDRLFLPDEYLPHSVGARWANEEVDMPDGTKAKFVEGSKLTHIEVFAGAGTKNPIRDIERLVADYPGTQSHLWRKVKAHALLSWKGEEIPSEVHWYDEPSVGKKEIKFKKEL